MLGAMLCRSSPRRETEVSSRARKGHPATASAGAARMLSSIIQIALLRVCNLQACFMAKFMAVGRAVAIDLMFQSWFLSNRLLRNSWCRSVVEKSTYRKCALFIRLCVCQVLAINCKLSVGISGLPPQPSPRSWLCVPTRILRNKQHFTVPPQSHCGFWQ
jgi:hypothetical protein